MSDTQQQQGGSPSNDAPNRAPSVPTITDPVVAQYVQSLQNQVKTYERQYNGLQGQFKKLSTDHANLQGEFGELNQSFEGFKQQASSQTTSIQGQFEQTTQELGTVRQTLQERESELARFQRQAEIQSHLLTEKYAPLIPLYEKKTLRPFADDGTPLAGEDLLAFFDAALETVGDAGRFQQQQQQQQRQQDSFGGRPPAGGNPAQEPDAEQLRKDLLNGKYKFGTPEYNAAMQKYRHAISGGVPQETGDFFK